MKIIQVCPKTPTGSVWASIQRGADFWIRYRPPSPPPWAAAAGLPRPRDAWGMEIALGSLLVHQIFYFLVQIPSPVSISFTSASLEMRTRLSKARVKKVVKKLSVFAHIQRYRWIPVTLFRELPTHSDTTNRHSTFQRLDFASEI